VPVRLTGDQVNPLSVTRATVSANQTTVATTSGTATALMTLPNAFYEGGNYKVRLWCINLTKGTTNLDIELQVDGVFSASMSGHLVANTAIPTVLEAYVTLTPGNHIVRVVGFVDAGTGTLLAGTGATGQNPNAILEIFAQ
jgi:hypothetical protein